MDTNCSHYLVTKGELILNIKENGKIKKRI